MKTRNNNDSNNNVFYQKHCKVGKGYFDNYYLDFIGQPITEIFLLWLKNLSALKDSFQNVTITPTGGEGFAIILTKNQLDQLNQLNPIPPEITDADLAKVKLHTHYSNPLLDPLLDPSLVELSNVKPIAHANTSSHFFKTKKKNPIISEVNIEDIQAKIKEANHVTLECLKKSKFWLQIADETHAIKSLAKNIIAIIDRAESGSLIPMDAYLEIKKMAEEASGKKSLFDFSHDKKVEFIHKLLTDKLSECGSQSKTISNYCMQIHSKRLG